MHYRIRRVIFIIFLSIFVIGAPTIVFYTAGYRLNFTTLRVQQTGVIALSSIPKGAMVFLNEISTNNKTPYVIQRLSPGDYTISMSKEGYKPWEQRVSVNSGATTYVTGVLFADSTPELLLPLEAIAVAGDRSGRFINILTKNLSEEDSQYIVRFDTVTQISRTLATVHGSYTSLKLSPDESILILDDGMGVIAISTETGAILGVDALDSAINPLPNYIFLDNGTNTELKNAKDNSLIALLPPGEYSVAFRNNIYAVLNDSRDRTYLFTFATGTITQINLPTTLIAMNESEVLFAGSDGNEIDFYDPNSGTTTLIARQSAPIISIGWYGNGEAVICATKEEIFAIAKDKYETREVTSLVDASDILGMWPDTTGKSVTFFGKINGVSGVWTVALIQ